MYSLAHRFLGDNPRGAPDRVIQRKPFFAREMALRRFSEGFADCSEWSGQGADEAQDRVGQGGQRLRRGAGAHAAGVLAHQPRLIGFDGEAVFALTVAHALADRAL